MRKIRFLLALPFLFILTGCSTETENLYNGIEITDIAVGNLLANEVIPQQKLVITTQAVWDELLTDMESVGATEDFSGTEIDFNSYKVLAVFDKIRPHTGHSIKVNQVLEADDHLLVKVSTQNTESGFTVLVQPFHLVKIRKNAKPVFFD